ncbi:MAG TPA: RNA polymerase sigma factor RpoD/SigA [Kofleriaceae bacterium]|nr:RNA polymerase sigma factor RpoD/SigA [Kofleriaceae bacterium]
MAATRLDTYSGFSDGLERYYRDMAAHELLSPEREVSLAKEIERREHLAWRAVLSHAPALEKIVSDLETQMDESSAALDELRRAMATERALDGDEQPLVEELLQLDRQRRVRSGLVGEIERACPPEPPIELHRSTTGRRRRDSSPDADWRRYASRVRQAEALATAAREAFITANLRLVVTIARRFRGRGLPLSDLIQEGNLGLMRAVDRFDYRKGFRFSTFASWWIMASIRRAVLDKGQTVRVPIHLIETQRHVRKIKRDLANQLGRSPTSAEIAQAATLPIEKVEEVETGLLVHAVSLDRQQGDEEDGSPLDVFVDPESQEHSPREMLFVEDEKRELELLVKSLSPVEADVIRRRYGLDDEQEQTLQEIGNEYRRSRERIRQIEARALAKLRRALRRRSGPEIPLEHVG